MHQETQCNMTSRKRDGKKKSFKTLRVYAARAVWMNGTFVNTISICSILIHCVASLKQTPSLYPELLSVGLNHVKEKLHLGKYSNTITSKASPKSTTQSYTRAGPQTTLNGCGPNMVAVIFLNWKMEITQAFCVAPYRNTARSFFPDSLPHLHIHWDINYLSLSTMIRCITMSLSAP